MLMQTELTQQPPKMMWPLFSGADQPARRAFGIKSIRVGAQRVPVATRDLVRTPWYALVEFCRGDSSASPAILIVPPLSGHFPILLRDMVLGLLPDFRVHLIDWINARHVPTRHGRFGLDDNIRAVTDAVHFLGPDLSIAGLCQGGIPALAATALLAAAEEAGAPRALVLIGAPIDPLANPTRVVRLIRACSLAGLALEASWPVPDPHAGHGRLVYPAEAQLAALMTYLSRQVNTGGDLLRKLRHDDGADPRHFPFLDLFTSIMDIDARHFLENIASVFHTCALREGTLRCGGRQVDLHAIRHTALLTVEGEQDDIAAPGQTAAAHALCSELPRHLHHQFVIPDCGHFSLFHGGMFRGQVRALIRDVCTAARPFLVV
jgi:poly(3-hydroxybutyrate) depolymerase